MFKTKSGTYRARIGFKGKHFHIGTYKTFDQAVAHRLEIEELLHDGFVKAYDEWAEKAGSDPKWAKENPLVYDVEKKNGRFVIVNN